MAQQPTRKKAFCLLATLLLLFALVRQVSADGGGHPFEQEVNGYHVNLVFEEPAKVGSNNIVVQLRSEAGESIAGAEVEVMMEQSAAHEEANEEAVDSHDSQPKETAQDSHDEEKNVDSQVDDHDEIRPVALETGHEPGEYHGSIRLPESGNWKLYVHFTHANEEREAVFPLTVASGYPKAGILSGFLFVNVAVVFSAAILKRKSAAAKLVVQNDLTGAQERK